MVNRLVMGAACALLAGAAASGCAAGSSDASAAKARSAAPPAAASAVPVSATATVAGLTRGSAPYAGDGSGLEAAWNGRLEIRSGCVVLESGGDLWVPVFPADTVLEADGPGSGNVRVGSEITLPLGAEVGGGGGYADSFQGTPAAECEALGLDEYVIIHSFDL